MEELLAALHRPPARPVPTLEAWILGYPDRPPRSPLEDAVTGGLEAGSLGLAFAAGYQAALRRLVPSHDPRRLAALAATERGGGHPKAIETALEGCRLRGEKRFVTLGAQAETLFVVARRDRGQRELVLLQLEATTPGVALSALPPTPFMPEIPHGALQLDVAEASCTQLPEDGYTRYLKPFRTLEDTFVLLALLAHAARLAREASADRALREELTTLVAALARLDETSPLAAATHLALGGALARARARLGELSRHLEASRHPDAAAWQRDLAVLDVADGVRRQRLQRAWEAVS